MRSPTFKCKVPRQRDRTRRWNTYGLPRRVTHRAPWRVGFVDKNHKCQKLDSQIRHSRLTVTSSASRLLGLVLRVEEGRMIHVPFAIALLVSALSSAAAAAPTFEAFTETFRTAVGTNTCFETGGAACTDSRTFTGARPGRLDAVANPGVGTLAVFGAVSFGTDPAGSSITGTTQSSALMRFTDIIITSSLPEPAPFVLAEINLDAHGSFDLSAVLGGAD